MSAPAQTVSGLLDACGDRFSDAQISAAVKRNSTTMIMELTPHPSIASGEYRYLRFTASWGDWEQGAAVYDADLAPLVPEVADLARGEWIFASEPKMPVILEGTTVDVYAAAADALETRETALAEEVQSFSGQGGSFTMRGAGESYRSLVKRYRGMARVEAVGFERIDAR